MFPKDESERVRLGMYHYHCYNGSAFTEFDAQIGLTSSYGMQTDGVIYNSPTQFHNPGCEGFIFGSNNRRLFGGCVPSDASMRDYEDYITFLAARYNGGIRGKVSHWIIWNEVGSYDWTDNSPVIPQSDRSDAADQRRIDKYAEMMRVAHRAIRRHQDSAMIYVSTDPVWLPWPSAPNHMTTKKLLEGLWTRLGTSIDWSVAVHPYGWPEEASASRYTFGNLSMVETFQHDHLKDLGITNVSEWPQAYLIASEQNVSFDPSQNGEREQARWICTAHDLVVKDPFVVATGHNYFHSVELPGSLSDQGGLFGLIPYRIPRDLTGMEQTETGKAYIATGDPYKWSKVANHYCCKEFQKGCPLAADTDENYLTDPRAFNPEYYRSHNADLAGMTDIELKTHWLAYGVNEGRAASAYLDPREYLSMYLDLQNAFGATNTPAAVRHYVEYGIQEGRAGRRAFLSFDAGYYHQYADLRALTDEQLYNHWVANGQSEGRSASRRAPFEPEYFDPYFYRNVNEDLDALNMDVGSLEGHWQSNGIREQRQSHSLFSIGEYIVMHPSEKSLFDAGAFTTLLQNFKNGLRAPGRFIFHSLVFNPSEYIALYADLRAAFRDNVQSAKNHWLQYGITEGRSGSIHFNTGDYLALNPDVARVYGSNNYFGAIAHYVANGIGEGRSTLLAGNQSVFDAAYYRAHNADLASMSDAQLLGHWVANGIREARRASEEFSVRDYLARYPDLQTAFGSTGYEQAVRHYVLYGKAEGRNGKP
ncbi:MAG: hypothetical protein HY460_00250 [Parcubacteria group bacterium]|nr:hypothetical protein [Parcubacteria group bacterium]